MVKWNELNANAHITSSIDILSSVMNPVLLKTNILLASLQIVKIRTDYNTKNNVLLILFLILWKASA